MGLNENQVNEIAKLPSGVAVVYQNDWVSPVLTMIDKADIKESPYVPKVKTGIRTEKSARSSIVKMLMQQWINGPRIKDKVLLDSIRIIDIPKRTKNKVNQLIDDYSLLNGHLYWKSDEFPVLSSLLREVFNIKPDDFESIDTPDELRDFVEMRTGIANQEIVDKICYLLTYSGGESSEV